MSIVIRYSFNIKHSQYYKKGENMEKNYCIKCEVSKCQHNNGGNYCSLSGIKVGCGCGESCTCCEDYSEKE